jgi:hypothetical protein
MPIHKPLHFRSLVVSGAALTLALGGCAAEGDPSAQDPGDRADLVDPGSSDRCVAFAQTLDPGPATAPNKYWVRVDAPPDQLGSKATGVAFTTSVTGVDLLENPYVQPGIPVEFMYTGRLAQIEKREPTTLGLQINGDKPVFLPMLKQRSAGNWLTRVTTTLPADARGEIQFWFQAKKLDSEQIEFDSLGGGNYHVPIVPPTDATICFDDPALGLGLGPVLDRPVLPGTSLAIAYDYNRILAELRQRVDELGDWDIGVTARFFDPKGGLVGEVTRDVVDAALQVGFGTFAMDNLMTPIAIPAGAVRGEIVFTGTTVGASVLDPADGTAHAFEIAAPEGDETAP